MGLKYRIRNQSDLYFVTFTAINWVDIFIRESYRQIFIDSVKYCQQNKGLVVGAYVIMTSHVHMIIGTNDPNTLTSASGRFLACGTKRMLRQWGNIFLYLRAYFTLSMIFKPCTNCETRTINN